MQREVLEGQFQARDGLASHFISCAVALDRKGRRVFVNVEFDSDYAEITVEILDLAFRPLPGYSGAECIPVTESGLRQPVRWRSGEELEHLNHPIRIRVNYGGIRVEDTRLYAVYVS